MADATGNFAEDGDLIEGIRQVKDRLQIGAKDRIGTCIAGKQVSATQIAFRNLPHEEMEPALRLEMRKAVPFEIGGSTLDFQILSETGAQSETSQVLVAVAGAGLLNRQLRLLEKSGLAPSVVDVLPIAIANSLWDMVGAPKNDVAHVALHIGPQISTIVVEGARSPHFNRYIYFAAEDFVGKDTSSDLEKRVQALADEVSRSLVFYEKSAFTPGFQPIHLLGDYLDTHGLSERLRRQTGLDVRMMDLPRKLGLAHEFPAGRFDLAVSLALRAVED